MTQAMSQQIASTKLRFHSIIFIQTWKWLLHVELSLSLSLSHLNINEKYNLSSQPPTLSIKWLVPCKKNWSNSFFVAFLLYLHCFLTLSLLHVESYRVRKIDQFLIKFNAPSDYHSYLLLLSLLLKKSIRKRAWWTQSLFFFSPKSYQPYKINPSNL